MRVAERYSWKIWKSGYFNAESTDKEAQYTE